MVKKINLDGMSVLAGMEWTTLPNDRPYKKAFAEYLSNNKGLRHGIIMQFNDEASIGRIPEGQKLKHDKTPSASALLALANQRTMEATGPIDQHSGMATSTDFNWISAQLIDGSQDTYWVGAVRNGIPVAPDVVGSLETITERIEELLQITSFTIHTKDKNVRYNFAAMSNVVEKSFSDLVIGVDNGKAEIKTFSIAGILTVGILSAAIILSLGWWGWTTFQEKSEQKRLKAQNAELQMKQRLQLKQDLENYEKEVRQNISNALDQGMEEVNKQLASTSPLDTMIAWRDLIYSVDLAQSTWMLEGFNCSIEDQVPFCVVNLSRGSFGNNRQLLLDKPDAIIDGDKASYVVKSLPLNSRDVTLNDIENSVSFQKGLLTELQILRQIEISHQATASKDLTKVVTLPPPPPSVMQIAANAAGTATPTTGSITINLGYASGDISVSGNGLWQLSGIGKYLNLNNIKVSALNVQFNSTSLDKTSWKLNGAYVLRNLNQPVIPEVNIADKKIIVEVPDKYKTDAIVTGGLSETTIEALPIIDNSGIDNQGNTGN